MAYWPQRATHNAAVSDFNGVGMPELVRREAPAHAGFDRLAAELRARGGACPVSATAGTVDDAKQRPDGKVEPQLEPRLELVPAPGVHADFAASFALAVTDKQRAAGMVEIRFGESERFLDAQPGTPHSPARHRITTRPHSRRPCAASPATRMTAMISSTFGGSAG